MDEAQLHLGLIHLPVIVAPVGLVILIMGALCRRKETLSAGLGLLVLAALLTVPGHLSEGRASAALAATPAVPAELMVRHRELAALSFAALGVTGLAALIALARVSRRAAPPSWHLLGVVLLALVTSVLMAVTANFGSRIRNQRTGGQAPPISASPP